MESRVTTAPGWAWGGHEDTPFGQQLPLKRDSDKRSSLLPSCLPGSQLVSVASSSVLLLFSGLIGQLWRLHRHLTFSEASGERISANPVLPPCLAQEVSEGRARPLPPKKTESLPLCPVAIGDKAQPVIFFLPPSPSEPSPVGRKMQWVPEQNCFCFSNETIRNKQGRWLGHKTLAMQA